MENIQPTLHIEGTAHDFPFLFVEGTGDKPFLFGEEADKREIYIRNFYIAKFPVTQALWKYVMGTDANRSFFKGDERPVDHVSWYDITQPGGFLEKIHAGTIINTIHQQTGNTNLRFRLPSESEWEYAARGGKYRDDNFAYSGSNHIEEVAWYKNNSGTATHAVGQKAPNQLGIHDMSGNVWEWCQDHLVRDTQYIPKDGNPYVGESAERILRGGCHHNWDIHCRVDKRYAIIPEAADECIGFRLVLQVQ